MEYTPYKIEGVGSSPFKIHTYTVRDDFENLELYYVLYELARQYTL